ncbi:DUF1127 domain-containing protein [Cognatishimia sp. F0-27]|uniref:DUF1127 domain-containing protein n=1 Tax=Cognatishimia sp. F0-27 TaxID=2816855 RepID=UPI001D0C2C42|nr:DUF1127 domain-containing protein [Cognatishimia sp. F0-27]MCC1493616.1 DUF1127 domain-containing protein [Cognatishimia sp. F0-27]
MAQDATFAPLAYLTAAQSLPPAAKVALRLAVVFAKWSERHRTRLALAQLDSHLLADVGLDRRSALLEARRPFWVG